MWAGEMRRRRGRFSDVLAELGLPADSPIHYEEGDPAEAILAALARENIDVLVAGALEKEIVLHPFLGNVARRLVRDANCSVMLFTPSRKKNRNRCAVSCSLRTTHSRDWWH